MKLSQMLRSTQDCRVSPAGSYLYSSDKRAHFGLGAATEATVEIHWPSGVNKVLKNVKANQILKVDEPGRRSGVQPIERRRSEDDIFVMLDGYCAFGGLA
jgi:hypothetical protein